MTANSNADREVVTGFGDEWQRFNRVDVADYDQMVDDYFHIFPWDGIPANAEGFDLGCGTGRWAKYVATRVAKLHCIDASKEALQVARRNLAASPAVVFHHASVESIPLQDASADFGYSLGVLHHVPDTAAGLKACVKKLKPGAPFLLYLYFAFDNKPRWYRRVWLLSEFVRKIVSKAPHPVRFALSQVLALCVYWPFARCAYMLEKVGMSVDSVPLAYYRDKSMYVIRTDALDRFGTRLEQRFSRVQIERMMRAAGLERVVFSDRRPYWVALGYKTA
jgi:SAM-dependent methyltransferase